MKESHQSAWLVATLAIYAVAAAAAPQPPETFAREFISAVISKNPEYRKDVIHPAARTCITPQTQPYFDWIFSRQAQLVGTGSYKITVTPVSQMKMSPPIDGEFDYPLRPALLLQIDFGDQPHGATLLLFIARDNDKWREVLPCPRGDAIAQAQAKQIAARKQAQKVEGLIRQMPESLRTEITALLKNGRKVDAIRRYAIVTSEDITTAKDVIESLRQ